MAQNIWDKFDNEIDTKGLAADVKDAAEMVHLSRMFPMAAMKLLLTKWN